MSDVKGKVAEVVVETTSPVISKAINNAPAVAEKTIDAVDIVVEFVEKTPLSKKLVIGAVAAVTVAGIAAVVGTYFVSKRKAAQTEDEEAVVVENTEA